MIRTKLRLGVAVAFTIAIATSCQAQEASLLTQQLTSVGQMAPELSAERVITLNASTNGSEAADLLRIKNDRNLTKKAPPMLDQPAPYPWHSWVILCGVVGLLAVGAIITMANVAGQRRAVAPSAMYPTSNI